MVSRASLSTISYSLLSKRPPTSEPYVVVLFPFFVLLRPRWSFSFFFVVVVNLSILVILQLLVVVLVLVLVLKLSYVNVDVATVLSILLKSYRWWSHPTAGVTLFGLNVSEKVELLES